MAEESVKERFARVKAATKAQRNYYTCRKAGPHVFEILKFKVTLGVPKVSNPYWIFECKIVRAQDPKDIGQRIDIVIDQKSNNGADEEARQENRDKDASRFKAYCASALGIDSFDDDLVNAVMGSDFYDMICEQGAIDGALIGVNVVKKPATKKIVVGGKKMEQPVFEDDGETPKWYTNMYPLDLRIRDGWTVDPSAPGTAVNEAGESCPRIDVTITGA